MTLGQVFEIATDQELRLLAGFVNPPRAGEVVQTLGSGQVEVLLDDVEGGTVRAWPLNGWTYADGTLVYVVFASDNAESGIVVGAVGAGHGLSALAGYAKKDGTPAAGRVARWKDSSTVEDAGFAVTDVARLSQDQTFAGVNRFDGEVGIGTDPGIIPFLMDWPTEITTGQTLARYGGYKSAGQINVEFVHTGAANVGNEIRFQMAANTSTTKRTILEIAGAFDNITDATRNAVLRWYTVISGTFQQTLGMTGKLFGLFNAAASPQGMLHAHNGTGGVIAKTVGSINSTTYRVIIPDAAGDVLRGVTALVVAQDGTTSSTFVVNLLVGATFSVVVGTLTLRFQVTAGSAFQVQRQTGTGTGTIMVWAVWM